MSRDRKGSPSVSPSESSEAWLESHASELVDCGRMRCRMLARHCGTRESCFRGGRCPKAPRGARPVQTERASMPCTTQTRIVEMKLFRKEKKPAGAYCCPICKRGYRHAGMAERCTKTVVCRLYNTPPAEVRETWRLVGGAASLGWFLAHPILGTEPEDSGLYGAARAVQDTTGELFAALHKVFPCADHVRRALHAALMGEVAGIWPPGRPAHLGHVGDVIRSVICDARGEAVARAVRPGLLDGMRELEERVEALYDEIIPEGEADYEEDAIEGIVRLSDAVIGPKPEGRKPSLYLVNGRHLVVGRGRADVRRVMMGFGLSKPRIQGISPGEKFEDGRTAEDIIKTAVRVPALIGRMEE